MPLSLKPFDLSPTNRITVDEVAEGIVIKETDRGWMVVIGVFF